MVGGLPRPTVTAKRAKLGIWNTTAQADMAPYLVPQETGNHEDVRWAYIFDADCHGLLVEANDSLALSLLPHSSLEIENATHQNELAQPRHMFLRLLAGQMGVGGDDSWALLFTIGICCRQTNRSSWP